MYVHIFIKWLKKSRKITLPAISDQKSLIKLVKLLFDFKDEDVIGVTDSNGKFFQIAYLAGNLMHFDTKSLELVTSKIVPNRQQEQLPQLPDQYQLNIQPISFASNTPNQFENDYNPLKQDSGFEDNYQLPEQGESQILGQVHNLPLFQQTLLSNDLTVIIESQKKLPKLQFQYFYVRGKQQKIRIFKRKKKICQIPFSSSNLNYTQQVVLNLIKSFQTKDKILKRSNSSQGQDDCLGQFHLLNESQEFNREQVHRQLNQQNKRTFFKQKRQNQRKYDFFAKKQSRSEHSQEPQRYDIPIIIRKSNNKIQKVNASYPLSQQQMQAINSLLQLQIQGLFSDEQINRIKMMVLGQNSKVIELFNAYAAQNLNVKDLCNGLAQVIRKKEEAKK